MMPTPDPDPTEPRLFPFTDSHGLDDALPEYRRLREYDPVSVVRLANGGHAYLVTRYDDVKRVFVDPVFSRAAVARPGVSVFTEVSTIPGVLLNMDPPDHTRIRRLLARAFAAWRVERFAPRIQEIADGLVDEMIAYGKPVNFVTTFATALPAAVISEMLGVPRTDHDRLRGWLAAALTTGEADPEQVGAALTAILGYLIDLIAAKRSAPASDLVGRLIVARDELDQLSEQELLFTVLNLIGGGYEPTASLLVNSLLALDAHPEQREALSRPEMLPNALEELLRHVPAVWSTAERVTTDDTVLSGVRIPAFSTVIPMQYAANHDTRLLADPERLDLTREPVSHLAFGHGIHKCIGAPLARLELQIAFTTLLRRLPGLRPAVGGSALTWKTGWLAVGPVELPVTWE